MDAPDDIIEALLLTPFERDILAGFLRAWRRKKRHRRYSRQARDRRAREAVVAALHAARFDDEMEAFGRLGPTPETRRKIRRDQVVRLYERGQIGKPEMQAAEEIREAREAVVRVMYPSRQMEPRIDTPKGGWRGLAGLEKLSKDEARLWSRYVAWAREMTDYPFRRVPVSRLSIVLDVIETNIGARQMEKRLGVKHGTVAKVVKSALRDYAEANGLAMRRQAG